MTRTFRLMCVLAHPDDEALGVGGALAKYAAEGADTALVTATRGERGWIGPAAEYPGPEALGRMRESELQAAAAALGIQHLAFLDYLDGELDQAEPAAAIAKIAAQIRRFRPDVVVTFGPDGAYGHPDHIAISQLTTAAVVHAAAPNGGDEPPHRVSKLYFRVWTPHEQGIYRAAFGDVSITVNDERRRWVGWPEWSISARLDTRPYWREVWSAVSCHQSQLPPTGPLLRLTEQEHEELWGTQHFYRAMSVVNGTHGIEDDLFAGLTSSQP